MDKRTYINVGRSGTFEASGNPTNDTTPQDVDSIISLLKSNNQKRIALYFHGGLVGENSGMDSAKRLNKTITQAGLHPISFVWETSLLDVLRDKLREIKSNSFYKTIERLVADKAGKRLPLKNGERSTKSFSLQDTSEELLQERPYVNFEVDQTLLEIDIDIIRNKSTENHMLEIQEELSKDFQENPDLYALLESVNELSLIDDVKLKSTKGRNKEIRISASFILDIAKISYRVLKRFWEKRDHGFYATLIEEILREYYIASIGSWVWREMKDKAQEMWYSNEDRIGTDQYAGTYLLTKLNEYGTASKPIVIDVVGHSAGSVVVCHLAREISEKYPNITLNNIIFLAPACRSELFKKEIVEHPERFNDIRIFTMSDQYEKQDRLVNGFGLLYPRSLLYFISGILEDKGKNSDAFILGLQRHIEWPRYMKFHTLKSINDFLNQAESIRIVYSKTQDSLSGQESDSVDHGYFDDDLKTLNSIQYILENGLKPQV